MVNGEEEQWNEAGHSSGAEHEHFEQAAFLSILRFVPSQLRFDHAPIEATGLSVSSYARGVVLMSSMFLGPALLKLANEAAGCQDGQECDDSARVYGFRPS
jgi:hypothetical protein